MDPCFMSGDAILLGIMFPFIILAFLLFVYK